MKKEKNVFRLEKELYEELFSILQGEMVLKILKDSHIKENDISCNYDHNSYLLDKSISKETIKICNSVMQKLEIKNKINFCVNNSQEFNIKTIPSRNSNNGYTIIIDSGILNYMNSDELTFLIGKQIGHILLDYVILDYVISLVFMDENNIPPLLNYKIKIWRQLSELSSDFYGYQACSSTDVVLSVIYKHSYGIHSKGINLDKKAIFKENINTYASVLKKGFYNYTNHPVCPIRLKFLEKFDDSNDIGEFAENLVEEILKIKNTEFDYYFLQYLTSGGVLIANADNDFCAEEYDIIANMISKYTYLPITQIEEMNKKDRGEIFDIFNNSLQVILKNDSKQKENLITYLIDVALVDNKILESEVELIYEIGEKLMGYSRNEIANLFLTVVKKSFYPNICKF